MKLGVYIISPLVERLPLFRGEEVNNDYMEGVAASDLLTLLGCYHANKPQFNRKEARKDGSAIEVLKTTKFCNKGDRMEQER
jgi:hypothetical protein